MITKDMNIPESNKLITEFMEVTFKNGQAISFSGKKLFPMRFWTTKTAEEHFYMKAKFHSSWDWLMPVVEKIEILGYNVCINTNVEKHHFCSVYTHFYNRSPKDNYANCCSVRIQNSKYSKIETVYKAVVEFIKWYNENKK